MPRRYPLIVLAVLAALVAGVLLWQNEEEKIRARLEALRELAEIRTPEGNLEVLVKSRRLGEFFTTSTVYEFGGNRGTREVPSREELVRRIARIRARLARLELALEDMQVEIDGDSARVQLRGSGLGRLRGEEGRFLEIHSVEIQLVKVDGDWLVAGARHLRDERQPAG